MKYDVLERYKEYLLRAGGRPETARTYFNRLDNLLEGQDLIYTVEKLDMQKIIDNLSKIKYKNHFSQSKNALLHFLEFKSIPLTETQAEQIKQLEKNTRKKYRKQKNLVFQDIDKKINHLRNKKLKLSYQTLLETGLRVSELAQITKNDCTMNDDEIHFSFIGKGGNQEETSLLKMNNPKLFEDLKAQINSVNQSHNLFYSAIYLQTNAKKLGCGCHDLRRICAKREYKKTKSKEAVQKKLRHTNVKTTNLYLRSKIKI